MKCLGVVVLKIIMKQRLQFLHSGKKSLERFPKEGSREKYRLLWIRIKGLSQGRFSVCSVYEKFCAQQNHQARGRLREKEELKSANIEAHWLKLIWLGFIIWTVCTGLHVWLHFWMRADCTCMQSCLWRHKRRRKIHVLKKRKTSQCRT